MVLSAIAENIFELSDSVAYQEYCRLIEEVFIDLLNSGIEKGASDLNDTILKDAALEKQTIDLLAEAKTINKILKMKTYTAKETNKLLLPYTEKVFDSSDKEMIDRIIREAKHSDLDEDFE